MIRGIYAVFVKAVCIVSPQPYFTRISSPICLNTRPAFWMQLLSVSAGTAVCYVYLKLSLGLRSCFRTNIKRYSCYPVRFSRMFDFLKPPRITAAPESWSSTFLSGKMCIWLNAQISSVPFNDFWQMYKPGSLRSLSRCGTWLPLGEFP